MWRRRGDGRRSDSARRSFDWTIGDQHGILVVRGMVVVQPLAVGVATGGARRRRPSVRCRRLPVGRRHRWDCPGPSPAQRGAGLIGAQVRGTWVRGQKSLHASGILPRRGDRPQDDDALSVAAWPAHRLGETEVAGTAAAVEAGRGAPVRAPVEVAGRWGARLTTVPAEAVRTGGRVGLISSGHGGLCQRGRRRSSGWRRQATAPVLRRGTRPGRRRAARRRHRLR